jgi:hypothetical protein
MQTRATSVNRASLGFHRVLSDNVVRPQRTAEAMLPLATNECGDWHRRFHAHAQNFADLSPAMSCVSGAVNDGQ